MRARLRIHREERGISTVIVAVSLVGIIGAAMISLDAGNMWQTRRNIITGTDSTALDQAKFLAFSSDPVALCRTATSGQLSWEDYMLRNSGGGLGVDPIACDAVSNGDGTGYVVVQGRKEASTRFGGLFGIGNTNPYSYSAAEWGYITEAEGLRPMGICGENEHIQEWLAFKNNDTPMPSTGPEHPIYSGAGVVHRIMFTKENPDACGEDAPGNWGWMDFECNNDDDTPESVCGNPNSTLVEWILNGYQPPVGVGDCDGDAGTPGGESGDYCNGETGSSGGSVANALQTLVDNHTKFAIPIFDTATDPPGNNTFFNMKYFVGVKLWGFQVTGDASERYFDFEFVDLVTSGNCCSPVPEVDTGLRGITLCDVDHDGSGLPPLEAAAAKCL